MGTTTRGLRAVMEQGLEREVVGTLMARVRELEAEVAALKSQSPVPRGTSRFEWEDGDYQGEWQGRRLEDDDGECPEEVWYQKRPHGRGEWQGANGDTYTGQWREGNYHGTGRQETGPHVYQGEFKDGGGSPAGPAP